MDLRWSTGISLLAVLLFILPVVLAWRGVGSREDDNFKRLFKIAWFVTGWLLVMLAFVLPVAIESVEIRNQIVAFVILGTTGLALLARIAFKMLRRS